MAGTRQQTIDIAAKASCERREIETIEFSRRAE
jgi:hypothetical protein